MKYNCHGDIELNWLGNILICKPSGSINFEGAQRFHQLINDSIATHNYSRWARIEYFTDMQTLATLDAYELLTLHLEDIVNKGCIFIGLVSGNALEIELFKKACCSIGLPCKEFNHLSEAIEYITNSFNTIFRI
ncbi:hypothetical protein [Pseudoalteromonas denitrificans]|uniref:Uncharacterized protein n=1 Tax=Pseudoalteromonas denitrificans DSM 6059 TaxID=1123010 RepID=A0A1I1NKV2_9GAMM|nr:hypothetical protein [Pseudoalteromonas denitrificans]SFC96098.1 hypothetical protein SAMN02745724_03049 [Pseudoalteromonas denitrificans DSM 6059]